MFEIQYIACPDIKYLYDSQEKQVSIWQRECNVQYMNCVGICVGTYTRLSYSINTVITDSLSAKCSTMLDLSFDQLLM